MCNVQWFSFSNIIYTNGCRQAKAFLRDTVKTGHSNGRNKQRLSHDLTGLPIETKKERHTTAGVR
jgi:hypothetical protein